VTSGTILVADDDAAIRTVLNQALSRSGYTVRLTSNAATLWRWVAEGEGDVVITDVVMPDGNAFDLVGERVQKDFKSIAAGRIVEETIEIKVRNHKNESAEVLVYEHPWRWRLVWICQKPWSGRD
jgi:DNA-binding NtrC family response regulator